MTTKLANGVGGKLSSYVPNERGGRRFSFSKSSMQRERCFVHVQVVADEEGCLATTHDLPKHGPSSFLLYIYICAKMGD